jgi:NitT/TauT family transport system ATP-binding protein
VLVRGHKVTGPGRDRGMIFQKYSSFPHRTVLENVTFGLELNQDELKLSRSEREGRAVEWIRKVGLGGHERKYRTSSRAASSSASRSHARWC